MSRLDDIKARADAATPGVWVVKRDNRYRDQQGGRVARLLQEPANLDLMAHSRDDIRDLLAVVEAAIQHVSPSHCASLGLQAALRPLLEP